MSDYIKREDAIAIVRRRVKKHTTTCVTAVTELQELPAADVRENVKGEWTDHQEHEWIYQKCSVCGYNKAPRKYPFCPNCGADMRGGCCG